METITAFEYLNQLGSAPLMALVAFMLWKIEKRITILSVKIEYAAGLRSADAARRELISLGADETEI